MEVERNLSGHINILRQAVTAEALQRWHLLFLKMPVPHMPTLRKSRHHSYLGVTQDLFVITATWMRLHKGAGAHQSPPGLLFWLRGRGEDSRDLTAFELCPGASAYMTVTQTGCPDGLPPVLHLPLCYAAGSDLSALMLT